MDKKCRILLRRYDEFDVADKLRERGWVLPAYSMAPDAQAIRGLRVVCREDFSRQSADTLLEDIIRAVDWLDAHYSVYTPQQVRWVTWAALATRCIVV